MAGKSVSHHHCHSAWQRTELRWVYGDTVMTEMGCVTAAYRDAGVTEMGCATGSMYLGDPRVDRSDIILSYNKLDTTSFESFDHTRSFRDSVWIHAIAWVLTAE